MLTRDPDLDALLDLRYEPIVNQNPRSLTRPQVEQYNARGYIDPVPIFEGADLERVQRFFRDNESRVKSEGTGDSFLSFHHLVPELYDVVSHPRTLGYLRDLIGPDVVCHVSQFINKPPGQTKGGSYHQDATFNAMDARSVIVWLAVQDADVENGCMWFIPGSHRLGVVACDANHYVVEPSQYAEGVPCPVPAGFGIIMSDLVMHSSPPNRSKDRYRPGFTATYASAHVRPHKQANRWTVQCSGSDPHGYWQPHVRPEGPALFA